MKIGRDAGNMAPSLVLVVVALCIVVVVVKGPGCTCRKEVLMSILDS